MSLNETINDIWDQLLISGIVISEYNSTIKLKNDIIVEYVYNLVEELYDSAYDKIYYIIEINNLKERINYLESLLNSTN